MITLTDKLINYSVENTDLNIKLIGTVTLTGNGRIIALNGAFVTLDNSYIGNFYFNEDDNGNSSKNVSNVDINMLDDADKLLCDTINKLKQQINNYDDK